jgi:signal transduction histidine kinase
VGYAAVVAACFAAGMLAGWTPIAVRIDHYAYDLMMKDFQPPEAWAPQSVIVAIDEQTLGARGGMRNIRTILADALDQIAAANPLVVASDVTLHDKEDAVQDQRLAASLHATKNLILPCQIVGDQWEDPLPLFKSEAVALGHVHPETDRQDGVSRQLPLEITADGKRRWALALEAFRVARGQPIIESPEDLQVGDTLIPAARDAAGRPLLIRYLRPGIPVVSVLNLSQHLEMLRGKTVFLGITALGTDRSLNPYEEDIPGVAVHAHAFETLARGRFLTPASDLAVVAWCLLFASAIGVTFALRSGWQAYLLCAVLLLAAVATPVEFFRYGIVFRFTALAGVAWLSAAGAASFQHFFVRRQLHRSESEKSRYQQAIHWAAHEMRTPLTAIQGSSEIMTRYSLPDEKRHELSEMINSESKRLARVIQTFLDVERLADGQAELKRERFPAAAVVETCLKRAAPIAERKKISISLDTPVDGTLTGDRELMEYALYNLLTNAVKYSPAGTEVHVFAELNRGQLRLAVRDQGIGMDAKELKNIFKKFYRTKRAEASGEVGTGIGLSIVEQIVAHHGGRIEVTSEPGRGSCFTMILTASETATASHNAQALDRRG